MKSADRRKCVLHRMCEVDVHFKPHCGHGGGLSREMARSAFKVTSSYRLARRERKCRLCGTWTDHGIFLERKEDMEIINDMPLCEYCRAGIVGI